MKLVANFHKVSIKVSIEDKDKSEKIWFEYAETIG